MQGYETAGRLIFFGVWDFEYKIDIFSNRPRCEFEIQNIASLLMKWRICKGMRQLHDYFFLVFGFLNTK